MIKKISLKNMRCHHDFELEFNKNFVYIYGHNGSGKTSILESLYLISTTKSHRTTDEKEIIKQDHPFSQIKVITNENRYEMVISKQGKRTLINGVEKRKLSDFIGHLKVVMFAPEDLELIKGTPTQRRHFIDLSWMQLNKQYISFLNTYKKVLKQRNSLLKKLTVKDDFVFLDILGEQLLEVGEKIIDERSEFIKKLNTFTKEIYKNFSQHDIQLVYKPDVSKEGFKKHINNHQKQDILYQMTMVGPHRDDFYIHFNGFDAKSYASQGEQRLIVIAIKFGLLNLIHSMTKEDVILLLDDILSELDTEKQHIFLKHLPKNHQIIMNSAIPVNHKDMQMIHLKKE